MNSLNIQNNKFMMRAQERKSQREIQSAQSIFVPKKEEEIDDMDSPTSPKLQIPIFSPTSFIISITTSARTIK